LICVGPRARAIGEGAAASGFPPADIQYAENANEAARLLDPVLARGDTALFKASRGVGLDRAVVLLTSRLARKP
jgi:UDP-N-acetylmuramyl pentapeptide synthase